MRQASILLAQALVWIEPTDLNPGGVPFYPDMVKALASRFNFVKVPEKLEEFDPVKGIIFAGGRFDGTVIDQLGFYTYGIALNTRISTDRSKQLLKGILEWGVKEFGLIFKPEMAKRWQYSSHVTFYSDVLPLHFPKPLLELSGKVTAAVRELLNENLTYEPTLISIDYDQLTRKHPVGPFTIQRRENTPFSEDKYWSSAPLPTDVHIKLLEEFEKSLS
jgi:hypothetical protein